MPQRGQLRIAQRAQIAAENFRLALEVAIEAAQEMQERRLAAAALPLDGHELAALHFQIDRRQEILRRQARLARRVALLDASQENRGHGATISTSSEAPKKSGCACASSVTRRGVKGSITCATTERVTYDCGPVPYVLSGRACTAAASLPKSARKAAPWSS